MHKLTTSMLPIYMKQDTCELSFHENLLCGGSGSKTSSQMAALLAKQEPSASEELCYRFYRDICYEKDRPLFKDYDFRYDITVILPGTIGSECKKTSGHYHGYLPDMSCTYPEIYEVLEGKALYILQKVPDFSPDKEPVITTLKAVLVEKGQAIIIPPFYGHCSINVGDGPLAFSNLAVVSCPLHYEPIQEKQGLSLYAFKDQSKQVVLSENPKYKNLPPYSLIIPREAPDMGICFGSSVYQEFIKAPEKFTYMLQPGKSIQAMEQLLSTKKGDQTI